MTIKFGKINLFKFQSLSTVEILFLIYISSIIIISMMPIGNIISRLIGVFFLFYFIIFFVIGSNGTLYISREFKLIIIWLGFCLLSGLFAKDINLVKIKLLTLIQLVLFFIAGYSVILQGKINEKHIFYTFIFSVVIVVVYGIGTYEPTSGFVYKNRISSTTGNPNNLAAYASFSYIFCLYLINIEKNKIKKLFLLLMAMIIIYGIINTHSRQGLMLLIVSSFLYLAFRTIYNYQNSANRKRFYINGILLFASLIILSFIGFQYIKSSPYYFRIQTLLSFAQIGINTSTVNLAKIIDYSAYERSQFIIYGIKIWLDNLLFGIGLDNFRITIREYWPWASDTYSHNNYIELLTTIGSIGTLAYYGVYYSIFNKIYFNLKKNFSTSIIVLMYLFIIIMSSLIMIELVTVTYHKKLIWILFIIIIGYIDKYDKVKSNFDKSA